MSRPVSFKDALEDCLNAMRAGGDLPAAVARYPRHEAELRDDVRIAYALRRASFRIVPPEGAELRASMRLTNALREVRAQAQPKRRSGFAWLTGALQPLAVIGVAAVALLLIFGLGAGSSVSNPLGGTKSVEASTVEGVVVENTNGTLTLETPQGLTRVDLNQQPTIQDAEAKLLTISDIEAGQVVRVQAKKTPQGALIAKQVDRKPLAALQDWCADNGDACHEVAPRLEGLTNQCKANEQQCQRIQQSVTDLQKGLKELTQRITDLKNRCADGREAAACRQLMLACKDHPIVCAELKVRPAQGGPNQNNSGPGNGNGNGNPQSSRPNGGQRPNGNGTGPRSP